MRDIVTSAGESVCVFCASSGAAPPRLIADATRFGQILASAGVRLVYGGGGIGLMGACARAAHDAGGQVLGIIPGFLTEYEAAYTKVETVVVGNMHERKMRMFEESDAFAVLPGAIGTLEESIEILSWRRLGLHAKPIVFYNPDGFWDPLFAFFAQLERQRLVPGEFAECWGQVDDIEALLPALRAAPAGDPTYVPIVQRA
ncbi:MAG TPA: TIGR00730 family Rossman fold protein [Caulobacteraceae bacterium]|jgi:hypothetical protein